MLLRVERCQRERRIALNKVVKESDEVLYLQHKQLDQTYIRKRNIMQRLKCLLIVVGILGIYRSEHELPD